MTELRMITAILIPALLTGLFIYLQTKTFVMEGWTERKKQTVIGIAFGALAILDTVFAIPVTEDVSINVRDAAPFCAGLLFGGPAGVIAGVIGGVYRWVSGYWTGAVYTRLACGLASVFAGVGSGLLRKYLYEGKKPHFLAGFALGAAMEDLHMLLVLVTNLGDVSKAFQFVEVCTMPMTIANGLAVMIAIIGSGMVVPDESLKVRATRLSYNFSARLLVCMVGAFVLSSFFVYDFTSRMDTKDAGLFRSVTVYLTAFIEVLIFTALYILINQMLQKKVAANLRKINEGLQQITAGNLDTVIDVRDFREFDELSNDVNATVDTLKTYITEAQQRIDKELEFARQIQHSALPSVFPPYPAEKSFDIYATMDAAKEVGGDFYDFGMVGEKSVMFLIADVSGKGIPAAMFMMRAKTLIKDLAESGKTTAEVLTLANRRLCEGNDADMFITAWIGILNFETGRLTYSNAGHNPPLYAKRGGQPEYLRSKPHFVLAGIETTEYTGQELQLAPGDGLYLYTDGVTEAMNTQEELYGEERLLAAAGEGTDKTPEAFCRDIREDLTAFVGDAPQADDITMLAIRWNGPQQ